MGNETSKYVMHDEVKIHQELNKICKKDKEPTQITKIQQEEKDKVIDFILFLMDKYDLSDIDLL